MIFLVAWFSFCGLVAAVATTPFWLDLVIVWLMRRFNVIAFPNAIRLAMSLEHNPKEWTISNYELIHATIGTVKHHSHVGIICVQIGAIEWNPNWIERRIIYNSAKLMMRRNIHQHLNRTLPG